MIKKKNKTMHLEKREGISQLLVLLVLGLFALLSCEDDKKEFLEWKMKKYECKEFERYFHDNEIVRMECFTDELGYNGWIVHYNDEGIKEREGLALTKNNFVKYLSYYPSDNDYSIRIYYNGVKELKLQQFVVLDSNLTIMKEYSDYVIAEEYLDSIRVNFESKFCFVDSIYISDKNKVEYKSRFDEVENEPVVYLPKHLKGLLRLEYGGNKRDVIDLYYGRRVKLDLDFGMFLEDEDINTLKFIKEASDYLGGIETVFKEK